MTPKILTVRVCVNVQETLKDCFQQLKYFTNICLAFSGNKRLAISFFINPFQSNAALHTETSLLL